MENTDPALAATLNPLNTDARINVLVGRLNAGDEPLDRLAGEARAVAALSRADARSYSLVGAVEERRGDLDAATASYGVALEHSRTERYALTRMLSLSLAAGDVAAATRYFDLLLRRWHQFAKEIAPLVHDIAAQPDGERALRQALEKNPAWRSIIVRELMTGASGIRFVADLLAGSPRRDQVWREDVATTLGRLISLSAGSQAYALFQATLADDEAALAGYVFDPGFTRAGIGRGFDWSSVDTSAVDASLPASKNSPGLRLRFLDSPAKLGRPAQTLYLPAGNYTLSATASSAGLDAPKGLYWQVRCLSPSSVLGRVDLEAGTYTGRTFVASFSVPESCALQRLSLETGVTTSSWRDRYGGEVLITDVHVSRAGTGA